MVKKRKICFADDGCHGTYCAEIAGSHHEHWNGNGYPDGLKGEEIPLLARVVAIADAWDAMTGDRIYRKGMPVEVVAEHGHWPWTRDKLALLLDELFEYGVKVVGFDMGGTSTDVTHFNGEYERSFETLVAGVRMRAPMMNIHTVAAGGGSILHYDGSRFRVGPASAGADPGPACYRRGGPLTVTDCNVMLGKIQPDHFPAIFGACL